MSTEYTIQAVKIHLQTLAAQNTAIGLYTNLSALTSDANSGQADIIVPDASDFVVGEVVVITDDNGSETGVIDSIASNTVTVRVNLNNTYTTAANAVLSATSFRWIETELSGTNQTYAYDMLLAGGIPPTNEESNWKRGGDVAHIDPLTVAIQNAEQFFKTIDTAGVALGGLRCDIIEFTQDTGTSVITETGVYRGKISPDTWNTTRYGIPLEPAGLQRSANILTNIDSVNYPDASEDLIGTTIPATFGEFKGDRYAKMVRTANKETVFVTYDGFVLGSDPNTDPIIYPDPAGVPFPIVGDDGNTPPIMYKIKIGDTVSWEQAGSPITSGTINLAYFDDQYIGPFEGEGTDQFRQIESASVDLDTDSTIIELTLKAYFIDTLAGNSTATATDPDQSWIKIVDISRGYKPDVWPCRAYLDVDGNVITQGLNLFSYVADKKALVTQINTDAPVIEKPITFLRLPQYGYEDSTGGTGNNEIEIDLKLFNGNPDKMDSFLILPAGSVYLINDDTGDFRAKWGGDSVKYADGLYGTGVLGVPPTFTLQSGDLQNMLNNVYTDNATYKINLASGSATLLASIGYTLPDFPGSFSFDNVYVGIKTQVTTSINLPVIIFAWRRWIGNSANILATTLTDTPARLESLPDFYFDPDPGNKELYFYPQSDNVVIGSFRVYSGYTLYEASALSSEDIYKSVDELAFFLEFPGTSGNDEIEYYKIAIIFSKTISIEKAIYSPFSARIYNDTWGARKTAADLMIDPNALYEHVCRLQDYSEEGDNVTEFGKAYSPTALINTGSTLGGFDYSGLSEVNQRRPSFQILKYGNGWTDKIKKALCRAFWFTGYIDEDGKENIAYLLKSITPSDTVSLADVPEGMEIGDVEEPQPENIYSEPFVRYNYNLGSEKFDGYIGIENIHVGVWQPSYTPGLTGAQAERLYNRCYNEVWMKNRYVTKPPSDMTDQRFITSEVDAIWFLDNWITWMIRQRITVPVYYVKARSWHIGRHVYLNLPHQTNGSSVETVIEGIQKNKNLGACTLKHVILDDLPEEYYIRDVQFNQAGGADDDWVDTQTVYGDDNDKIDNI